MGFLGIMGGGALLAVTGTCLAESTGVVSAATLVTPCPSKLLTSVISTSSGSVFCETECELRFTIAGLPTSTR